MPPSPPPRSRTQPGPPKHEAALLAHREKLGPLQELRLEAASIVEAHRALGEALALPARSAVERRLASLGDGVAASLARARAGRAALERAAALPSAPSAVRDGAREYLDSLEAWALGAGLGALAPEGASVLDLALWAQDDNTGCQTGMIRRRDGGVLLWHTEEDTIGYFDAPRVVTMVAGSDELSAFVYPYQLPGPAFGWRRAQVHAVDSLFVRGPGAGACTAAASWVIWRLGPAASPADVARALAPFSDGCAISVVSNAGKRVRAEALELGGAHLASRVLPERGGAFDYQANAVRAAGPLRGLESLSPRARGRYEKRGERAASTMERLGRNEDPSPQELVEMLSNAHGGGYAHANTDVVGHAVALVTRGEISLHVESAAALPGDRHRARWKLT